LASADLSAPAAVSAQASAPRRSGASSHALEDRGGRDLVGYGDISALRPTYVSELPRSWQDPPARRSVRLAQTSTPVNARDQLIEAYLKVPERLRHRLPDGLRRKTRQLLGKFAPWEAGFDLTPPASLPGEATGPPDFVGIGAQKAGTTWWYELLATHPGVDTRPRIHKERHFFDRFAALSFGPGDVKRYHGWFPRRPGTIAGEWTPDYMVFPWAPALLESAAPATKLLVMLRDPVERFFSGLAHELRMGATLVGPVIADAFERGLYYKGLSRWLEHFDRQQILVLQYERCIEDPDGQLAKTFSFLGLTRYWVAETERPPLPAARARREIETGVRQRLAEAYVDDVTALASSFGEVELAHWPSFSYLVGETPSSTPSTSGLANSPTRRE
jgi:Sulfotransferase domain